MSKNAPDYRPELFRDFAMMPKFTDNIAALASLAEPEDWDYRNSPLTNLHPVLRNYFTYTYQRVAEEGKIAVTSDFEHCCWNTGLITPTQEPIFALFGKNQLSEVQAYWHFWRFARKAERDMTRFANVPDMAHYFDDPSVLVFDVRKELRVNVEHVVADNISRFPGALQGMNLFGLQNLVKGAIDSALQRVRRNYKIAIPQYYQGQVQLLLPLSLTDPLKADMALVVDRFPDFYRAATCLTLDMAYNNARQLARPDRDWLTP
jgi:Domain of unknown function (DUF3825)